MKRALICGVSGQDGAYLAKYLLQKNYLVYGTSRDAQISNFRNLTILGIKEQVKLESMALNDFRSVLQIIKKSQPDEIYNLAGQSSVGLSFDQPVETLESIATGTLNLLEAIRFMEKPIKLYNAGSSESFGDIGNRAADELTPFRPRSPYGVAKATAFWEVANYREAYDLFACSGILFNHESPLRPIRFVTQKIVDSVCQIYQGDIDQLCLGNMSIKRDWGWAPEYVEAMYLMLQQPTPDDYVIATGKSYSLEELVATAFSYFNLNWQDYVVSDPSFFRPTDLAVNRGNPQKAKEKLDWQAKFYMPEVIIKMIEARLN
ncbi:MULTISPECIES: GDP-mannose 4,6-dehydratase [unclassified Synechocystis]|uniref:GDP-mannose 4,6-dehydratase n=1 Tax=unclassified Synechocystis TaxID=2640012 RepID=UPI000414E1A7|nr:MULTISPECIES: GDP-mannose 4,6-dehydratase [unclassified Synechocystis]AIE74136.1 GDP-mannose 4,6 dehydratase [Synechocystis sp. PCC 6714]MCT0252775.1 GDP-mannose 4,6-dehydratase [Synechocystis sp. CS-94]